MKVLLNVEKYKKKFAEKFQSENQKLVDLTMICLEQKLTRRNDFIQLRNDYYNLEKSQIDEYKVLKSQSEIKGLTSTNQFYANEDFNLKPEKKSLNISYQNQTNYNLLRPLKYDGNHINVHNIQKKQLNDKNQVEIKESKLLTNQNSDFHIEQENVQQMRYSEFNTLKGETIFGNDSFEINKKSKSNNVKISVLPDLNENSNFNDQILQEEKRNIKNGKFKQVSNMKIFDESMDVYYREYKQKDQVIGFKKKELVVKKDIHKINPEEYQQEGNNDVIYMRSSKM